LQFKKIEIQFPEYTGLASTWSISLVLNFPLDEISPIVQAEQLTAVQPDKIIQCKLFCLKKTAEAKQVIMLQLYSHLIRIS
jgi:hypothetical protein